MLVIISGPSGVGKDTIIDALRQRPHDPDYHYVVTCTTRAPRPGEVDGVDYHFLDRETFEALREAGEFLEANEVHGNWYGTPRERGPRGARGRPRRDPQDRRPGRPASSRSGSPRRCSSSSSRRRWRTCSSACAARATETADELELRQRNAAIELARQEDYDYVVTNETGQVERTADADRRDHRRASTRGTRTDGSRLTAVVTRRVREPRPVTLGLEEVGPAAPRGTRLTGRAALVEVAVDAAGARGSDLHLPRAAGARRPRASARPSWSSSAAGRRSGSSSPRRRRRPAIDAQADRRSGPGRRTAAAAAGSGAGPLDRRPLSRAAGARLRAMLPPGLLERLELVAELAPAGETAHRRAGARRESTPTSSASSRRGPRPVRDLAGPDGRAGLLRRLRALADGRAGSVSSGRFSAPAPGRATNAGSG